MENNPVDRTITDWTDFHNLPFHFSPPNLLSQFRQHFRPQSAYELNTPHNQVPSAVDTGLGYLPQALIPFAGCS